MTMMALSVSMSHGPTRTDSESPGPGRCLGPGHCRPGASCRAAVPPAGRRHHHSIAGAALAGSVSKAQSARPGSGRRCRGRPGPGGHWHDPMMSLPLAVSDSSLQPTAAATVTGTAGRRDSA